MPKTPRRRVSAFTLVELMVVVLIIGILIGILIPVVGSIRRKAQAASSLAQLNALRGAIEAYQQTYGAYPGPLADNIMFQVPPGDPNLPQGLTPAQTSGCHVTQSENLVLGLLGGLRNNNGVVELVLDNKQYPIEIGTGPRSLNPASPGQHPAFYSPQRGELPIHHHKQTDTYDGCFDDNRVNSSMDPIHACFDSSIPEFVDKFSTPMPILYLRARKGAPGIVSDVKFFNAGMSPDSPIFQYDVRQYYGYIADLSTEPPSQPLSLGGRPQGTANRGLWQVGSSDNAARNIGYDPMLLQGDPNQGQGDPFSGIKGEANYAAAYLRHPTLNVPVKTATNYQGTPRSKDQFILISAGADRIFGTADDLTTFGTAGE